RAGTEADRAPVAIARAGITGAPVVRRSAVRVGAVDDPAEVEADRIGAVLMRAMGSAPTVHQCDSGCDHGTGSRIRRSTRATSIDRAPALHPSAGPEGGPVDAGTVSRI